MRDGVFPLVCLQASAPAIIAGEAEDQESTDEALL
jgi:hypothetical protein